MKNTPLPDFDLAPLQGFDPSKLETKVGRLIIALAVVFNDVKSLEWVAYQLGAAFDQWKPEHGVAMRGQMSGMVHQISRVRAGVLRGLMEVLAKEFTVMATAEFAALERGMPAQAATAWKRVVAMSRGKDRDEATPDSKMLKTIRNQLAFHYDVDDIANGYKAYFGDPSKAPFNSKAVVSMGRNAEATRFYFGDAATESAIEKLAGMTQKDFSKQIGRVAEDVNHALRYLISGYVHAHGGTLEPFEIAAPPVSAPRKRRA